VIKIKIKESVKRERATRTVASPLNGKWPPCKHLSRGKCWAAFTRSILNNYALTSDCIVVLKHMYRIQQVIGKV